MSVCSSNEPVISHVCKLFLEDRITTLTSELPRRERMHNEEKVERFEGKYRSYDVSWKLFLS